MIITAARMTQISDYYSPSFAHSRLIKNISFFSKAFFLFENDLILFSTLLQDSLVMA